ncbi:MAG: Energy-dependent translational throttle protein EttA [Verrucomicrobia subdivision 3 bacterium]|nr:Energy-dependent translational throttle protein EttA [Limisphaerales bacterium]MCS1417437.1 Energy-dependent translational throttle protein EttA [Limisphaerales bacterium]
MSDQQSTSLLSAQELDVAYNTQVILKQASMTICKGDRLGLVGRNGSGKSSFLRIITGMQVPDAGEVITRRDLRIGYLPQAFELEPTHTVIESIRSGAKHILDLIHKFESLPPTSDRHEAIERQILAVDGWSLDQRIESTMTHLQVPDGKQIVGKLSGGEKRRVALSRAIIAQPELLILDEPTNHLDNESIQWVEQFLKSYQGALLLVTHDRYFLDRITNRIVELANGTFYPYKGNYTQYLETKTERQASEATAEKRRQMFLRRELEWVRRGPKARTTKSKSRLNRFTEVASQKGPEVERAVGVVIPPPPSLGNRILDLVNVSYAYSDQPLFSGVDFNFQSGMKIGVIGRNGIGKTTLLKIIMGQLQPDTGTVKMGPAVQFNYVDQNRLQLNPEQRVIDAISDGTEFVMFGTNHLSLRRYLKRFLFADDRIDTKVKLLSGGERSRLLLATILKRGGNFIILDEPTNDLDLATLRVLEEALVDFPGIIMAVSHDRYFLNRICTGILAFEGQGKVEYSVGNYDYYLEKKERLAAPTAQSAAPAQPKQKARPRKLTWKESKELEGMEAHILEVEQEIERIEAIFTSPNFHQEHGSKSAELNSRLEAAKKESEHLYARWEELESIPKQGINKTSP